MWEGTSCQYLHAIRSRSEGDQSPQTLNFWRGGDQFPHAHVWAELFPELVKMKEENDRLKYRCRILETVSKRRMIFNFPSYSIYVEFSELKNYINQSQCSKCFVKFIC